MGKRFSAAAYDLPPASQMRCNDFLRACGIYVVLCMERAKGIEPSTYSLGSSAFVKRHNSLAAKPRASRHNGFKGLAFEKQNLQRARRWQGRRWPGTPIMLRQGASVIEDSRRRL